VTPKDFYRAEMLGELMEDEGEGSMATRPIMKHVPLHVGANTRP
jgi:hypothetical protein